MAVSSPAQTVPVGSQSVCILADYDNAFPEARPTDDAVNARIDELLKSVLTDHGDVRQIDLRLYGGWLEQGVFTQRASQLLAATAGRATFSMPHPTRSGLLRGSLSLATRLLARPDVEWAHTLRPRAGLPRFILAEGPHPHGCGSRDSACSMRELRRLTQRPKRKCGVASCAVTTDQAFRVREQKMVDTLICCDALHLARQGTPVAVVSGDIDVIPALVMAATVGTSSVGLYKPSKYASDLYDEMLVGAGIDVRYVGNA